MAYFIAFDLEGPLCPQDNAYELMKLFPGGDRAFEVISRYDDLLTLEDKPGYEPGDTLALIVPFLVAHGITENNILMLAAEASFLGGAEKLTAELESGGWRVFCITTTYEQYAIHLTHKLGIYAHNVACTPFALDDIREHTSEADLELVRRTEAEVQPLRPVEDDARIKEVLDRFFWEELPATALGEAASQIKPVGGRRKVAALNGFADKYGEPLSRWVVVGDSITDFRMLEAVDSAGGLAVAFNANEYALPHATMGLASTHIGDLFEVLPVWPKGGRKGVEKAVREKEQAGGHDDRGYFQWLAGRDSLDDVIETHRRIRRLVREEAGKLG